ncbi:MAG TPA: peptidase M48 [Sedimenticola sp.]|nr:peptidase M48 [Sedimenticola sp.]
MKKFLIPVFLLSLLVLCGCATNPVTGEEELQLLPESMELDMGVERYVPMRQQSGGDYRLYPGLSGYVERVGNKLASVSDRYLPYEFVIVNDSTPNAWALPGGKIAINRGLLVELKNEAELAAVLGHEIVHAAARHGAKGIERGLLLQGTMLGLGVMVGDNENRDLILGVAGIGGQLITQRYSREQELEADHYGMIYMKRAGYDPQAAVGLQQTFVRLSRGNGQNWLEGLFASHPPSQERVEKNRQLATSLGNGGRLGEKEYQKAIAGLQHDRPAYDTYDRGRELLERSPKRALKLAQKAIAIQPDEALFWSLKGDALMALKRNREAYKAYDQALARDNSYFRHYLGRGLVGVRLGKATAEADLENSMDLLPTAVASYSLGRLAIKRGDIDAAVEYLQQAAATDSPIGKKAMKQLLQVDLPRRPGKYIETELYRGEGGQLMVSVYNGTDFTIKDVMLEVFRRGDKKGRIRKRVPGILRPDEEKLIHTPFRGLKKNKQVKRYKVRVVRARVSR